MGVSTGSAFLPSGTIMDRLVLTISLLPVCVEDLEVPLKLGLWRVNLEVATTVLVSCGVEPSLPMQLTFLGVWKMRTLLRAASVMISFESTACITPKVS